MENLKKELDFGVFYTCFTERESVEYSLDLLYSLYPDIPVYLISDGGCDYSDLSAKFPKGKFLLEHDSRGRVPLINQENWLSQENQDYMKKSIFEFMQRIKRAFEYCDKEYILIMEPDVLVRGKLTVEGSPKILGSRVNPYHWAEREINEVLAQISGSVKISHYGATPAILERKAFLEINEFFLENESYVNKFCSIDSNFSNYDIFLSVFFAALGHPEIQNPELTECLRNTEWRNSGHPLLHQFREFYPKKNYTGRHSTETIRLKII
jgi:hypothetical protein